MVEQRAVLKDVLLSSGAGSSPATATCFSWLFSLLDSYLESRTFLRKTSAEVFFLLYHTDIYLPAARFAGFLLQTSLTTKINTIMKELIDILTSEDKSFEGLPWWVYMFVAPAAFVLMCLIGGTLS